MLASDLRTIGDRLYSIRKNMGLTQSEVAERAGLSNRAYADIERGVSNMRVETLLSICRTLHITPNDVLSYEPNHELSLETLMQHFDRCSIKEKRTAEKLLRVYMESLDL